MTLRDVLLLSWMNPADALLLLCLVCIAAGFAAGYWIGWLKRGELEEERRDNEWDYPDDPPLYWPDKEDT